MEVAVCPRCGATGGADSAGGRGAPELPRSDINRWEKTIIDRDAVPDYRERARFAAGHGDFYRPVGGDATEAASGGGGRVRFDPLGAARGGDSDHTIIDRRGGRDDDDDDAGGDTSDHTIFMRDGKRVYSGPLVYMVLRNGIRAGKVFLLEDETSIGRNPDNDIVISDETVSKRHAKVMMEEGRFHYWDLASANHSFVVGKDGTKKRIREPYALRDGDTIDLGEARMTYIEVDLPGARRDDE
ncbi:MAG: FHA domain-containing protein [Dehalococcoidia bacterium]|nr:FHA domain-containing protein [Dehalococcoidia bacterium]